MQEFLKGKCLKELSKGVAGQKLFLYPSVLQKAAIPVLKKGEQKNVIIRYSEMSGIKLTLLLPLINQQIKHALASENDKIIYSMVLCHTNSRCEELATFAQELTTFCSDIIDIVKFDQLDFQDVKIDWKRRTEEIKAQDDEDAQKEVIKRINKFIFVTPQTASTMLTKGLLGNAQCFNMIVDKVNMHQAFDLDQDLIEFTQLKEFKSCTPIFKTIFTTNLKGEHRDESVKDNYNQIKKCFMGK